jgi:hypothetical protein
VPHKPGTHFLYNTAGTYMQSAIVQKVAKFGQLYLQHGNWNGRQLIPVAWVEAATSRQTSNGSNPSSDWDQGYGYQFWRARHTAYRGDGAFGQFCIVMPEQDAVVAITSGVKDMQAVLNLQAKLASLTMPVQKGSTSQQIPKEVSGKKFAFPANNQKVEMLGLEFDKEDGPVTLIGKFNGGTEQRIACGNGEWKKGQVAFGTFPERPAAVSGAWTANDTYIAKICFYETPYLLTINLDFSNGKLRFDPAWNVSFGPTKPGQLVGEPK